MDLEGGGNTDKGHIPCFILPAICCTAWATVEPLLIPSTWLFLMRFSISERPTSFLTSSALDIVEGGGKILLASLPLVLVLPEPPQILDSSHWGGLRASPGCQSSRARTSLQMVLRMAPLYIILLDVLMFGLTCSSLTLCSSVGQGEAVPKSKVSLNLNNNSSAWSINMIV